MSAPSRMRKSTRKRIQQHRDDARRMQSGVLSGSGRVLRVLRQFRVDKSRIPADKLKDPGLMEEEARLNHNLANETHRLNICLHEAAHAIYYERIGMKCALLGPMLTYDREHHKFVGPDAMVDTTVIDPTRVLEMARALVAGGVVMRRLTNQDDGCDEHDETSFFSDFSDEKTKDELQQLWDQAHEDVEDDLKSPEFRQQLWDRAREFKREFDSKYKYVETPPEYFVAAFDSNDMQRVLNVALEREAA